MRCTRDDARARRGSGCTVLEQLAHAEEEEDVELARVEVLRAKEAAGATVLVDDDTDATITT